MFENDFFMAKIKSKIKEEAKGMKHEIKNRISGYIVAAFGLVAGLAWNDAIKSLIEYFFPAKENTITAKFVYAVLITFIVVVVSYYTVKFFKEEEEGRHDKK